MSLGLTYKAILIVILAAAGSSVGGVAYYYQQRNAALSDQVSTLNNNAGALNDQIAALKAEIANLTIQVSRLQNVGSELNQTTVQLQTVESQLSAANTQLQSLETQLSDDLIRVQMLEASFTTQLDSLKSQLAQAQNEITQLQAQIAQLQSQIGSGLCTSGNTLTIGGLFDLTSALSPIGTEARQASQLAIGDVNSFLTTTGCTVRFSISVKDYFLDNSVALADLQSFAASGVQAVVGPLNSGAAQYLLSFANSNHMVMISPSSSSAALSIPNDYLFRTAPNDAAQTHADVRMMLDRGATALIIVERHDSYGDGIANATASRFTALGGHLIATIPYDISLSDFTPIISTLYNDFQAANATYPNKVAIDVVAFEELRQLINQTNTQHASLLNGVLPWFGTDGVALDPVILLGNVGPIVAKVRLPSTLYESLNNSKTVSFYSKFATAYPGARCDVYCLGAYDDVWLAALATLQVGSYNGTRMQSALLTVASNYYGVTGWLGLDPNGDRIPASYEIWKVVLLSPTSPIWVLAGTYDSTTDSVSWTSPP